MPRVAEATISGRGTRYMASLQGGTRERLGLTVIAELNLPKCLPGRKGLMHVGMILLATIDFAHVAATIFTMQSLGWDDLRGNTTSAVSIAQDAR